MTSDDFGDITTYSTTIYINGSEKEPLLSNSVDDQTGGTIDLSGNIGKIYGDILKDRDAAKERHFQFTGSAFLFLPN